MSDEFSRYKIKEIGMEEYLLQMQKSSVKNVADRLLTERKVIQELGEGYKLTEKNKTNDTFCVWVSISPVWADCGCGKPRKEPVVLPNFSSNVDPL